MKFIITNIENFEDHNRYDCLFINEESQIEFFTLIGNPEIETPKSVLQILAANCEGSFGGDGSINQNDSRFSDETEVKTNFDYEI